MTHAVELGRETVGRLIDGFSRDNAAFGDFFRRHCTLEDIYHIDDKCVIFAQKGRPGYSLKYVVETTGRLPLSDRLQAIVLRGLKNQSAVQDVRGVQRLESSSLYEGVRGLFGPFVYLEGYNLAHIPPFVSVDPDHMLSLFEEDLDRGVLREIHTRGVLHHDVKPGNIVLSGERLHLIDWSTSVNFTERLHDLAADRVLGTKGFIIHDLDRSRDYFALGVSFALALNKEIPLYAPSRPFDFESETARLLGWKFGRPIVDYFRSLLHRSPEYNREMIRYKTDEDGAFGLDPSSSFGVGDTIYVEPGPLAPHLTLRKERPSDVPAEITWVNTS